MTADISPLKILIVDDSRVVSKTLEQMLRNLGAVNITAAASAAEAEEKLAAGEFDVLFLDWRMTGKSGVALMQQCREDRAYDSVAFVIVSGEDGQRYIQEALKSGATSYIVKPFTQDTLEKHVVKVVAWLEQRGRMPKNPPARENS
ncbi:MAG TPA: response regulator [Patescibacteria group bacterium]|nr:response regulator [Patescibacteria group bacterium]